MGRYDGLGKSVKQSEVKKIHRELKPTYSNSSPMPGRARRMTTAASGLKVFKISDMDYLKRFLLTGSTGSLYMNVRTQMDQHIDFLRSIASSNRDVGIQAVCLIEEISVSGRAARNDSALMALAVMCDSTSLAVRRAAFDAVPRVARTATHLFEFVGLRRQIRGLGRGAKRAINSWYLNKSPQDLAYQLAKYRQRNGWTHRDILRLSRPKNTGLDDDMDALLGYAVNPQDGAKMVKASQVSPVISAYEELKNLPHTPEVRSRAIQLITDHRLPFEVLPTEWLNDPQLWAALLPTMNPEALMRNLSRMTRLNMFGRGGAANRRIVQQKLSADNLRRARLHPLKLFVAAKAYDAGKSRGNQVWTPDPDVTLLLENAFHDAFQTGQSTGKKIYVGLDVSGSMSYICHNPSGDFGHYVSRAKGAVSCYEASAIMAKSLTASEPDCVVTGFSHVMQDITREFLGAKDLAETLQEVRKVRMGATNLSLPIEDALANPKYSRTAFDAFVIFTDNETNVHGVHPQALIEKYRKKVGKNTRFIVVGLIANRISIADPADPYMLDIGGFDAAMPKLISEFIAD